MAGNEIMIADFLFRNIGKLKLNHLGVINEIGAPMNNGNYTIVSNLESLKMIATEDAGKKADIYINGAGVSLKQSGASFGFNRLQRENLLAIFISLGFEKPDLMLSLLDKEVQNFHEGLIDEGRNRPWNKFFSENDFGALLKHLMLVFNPNKGFSKNPAQFILEAPSTSINAENIQIYSFEEYFNKYKANFKIAIRRSWIGQDSKSENGRAKSISKKLGNIPWVFENVSGVPKSGWMDGIDESQRKTVYYLMLEKVK